MKKSLKILGKPKCPLAHTGHGFEGLFFHASYFYMYQEKKKLFLP